MDLLSCENLSTITKSYLEDLCREFYIPFSKKNNKRELCEKINKHHHPHLYVDGKKQESPKKDNLQMKKIDLQTMDRGRLEKLHKDDLIQLCEEYQIPMDKKMTKRELVNLLFPNDPIYDSISPYRQYHKNVLSGIQYIPARRSGKWNEFLRKQGETFREENMGGKGIQTKKFHPLLENIQGIFFGDSFVRLLEPPPPSLYVVSYPGMPIKTLTRSFHKTLIERSDDVNTKDVSVHPLKKKIYLTFESNVAFRKKTRKTMFFEFAHEMRSNPRVDMLRQILRFPPSVQCLGFWFGNAELQITFYFDLLKNNEFFYKKISIYDPKILGKPLLENVLDKDGIHLGRAGEKITEEILDRMQRTDIQSVLINEPTNQQQKQVYYLHFKDAYLENSVQNYFLYLLNILQLKPECVLYVMLMNYSPLFSDQVPGAIRKWVPNLVKINLSTRQFLFDDRERASVVRQFNSLLIDKVNKHDSLKQKVIFMDINPLICDPPDSYHVRPEFCFHEKADIHLDDPNRIIYDYILSKVCQEKIHP